MGFPRQEYWSGLPFPSPCLPWVENEAVPTSLHISATPTRTRTTSSSLRHCLIAQHLGQSKHVIHVCWIWDQCHRKSEYTEYSICGRHYSVQLIPRSYASVQSVFSLFPQHKGRDRSSESCSDLLKVTQPGPGRSSRSNSARVYEPSKSPSQGGFAPREHLALFGDTAK